MRQIFRSSAIALATIMVAAGCGSDTPTENNPASITLTGTPAAISIARNGNGTVQLAVTRGGNYTGTVNLTAEGLPAGVTATFTPASLPSGTNTSILAIAVGATATPGAANFTVRASGTGVTSKTLAIALTIPSSTITLQLGGTTATVTQGASTTVPVTITRVAGYDQGVALTAEGLPTGVTATFTPATIANGSTTSTLTLTAAANAAVGTSNVTVRANGPGLTQQSATVALTVNAATQADFALTATPAALNVVAGANGQSTINVGRIGGFAGAVNLTVEGAPAGVTATLNPTSAPGNTSTLSITTTAAATVGTHNLTISGTGTGITGTRTTQVALTIAAAPGVGLTLTPTALSITQAQSGQTVLIVQRTGGLAGNIDMTVENLPAGVTASFAPNPVTGSTTTLTLNVAMATVPNVYNLTVRGTGAGNATGTAPLQLTVTAASAGTIAINTVPQNLSVQAGQQQVATVNIARGGGFSGVVNLTASGVPNGVTATFTPQAAGGPQSTLGFNASVAAVPGTYPITITGAATGLQNATTVLNLTITPAGGGANAVSYQFCDNTRIPLWFAYKDGAGAWTRVLADANNKFNFNINSDVGGVAYVMSSGGTTDTEVYYMTRAELQAQAINECLFNAPAGKTVNGSVQGLGAEEFANVVFGGDFAFVLGNTTFTMSNVRQGAQDLLGVRMNDAFVPNRLFLLRNQNIANNGNLPAVNFNDAVNSFAPATASVTYANTVGQPVFMQSFWYSPAGAFAPFAFDIAGSTSGATFYGIPTSRLAPNELHVIVAGTDEDGEAAESRAVYSMFRDVANKTITFGAVLAAPTYTFPTSGGVLLPRAQGNIQSDYDDLFSVTFDQPSLSRTVTLNASRGYFGTNPASYDLQTPNLVGLSGYNTAWGLAPVTTLEAAFTAVGSTTGNISVFADGTTWMMGFRRTTITP